MPLRGKWKTDQYCKHGTCWSEFKTSANAEFKLLSDIMEIQKKNQSRSELFHNIKLLDLASALRSIGQFDNDDCIFGMDV